MLEADSQTADHAASWVCPGSRSMLQCDDDEPQLISYPAPRLCRVRATAHSDKSELSNSNSAATSSQARKECSAEHDAGDERHHPIHEQPRRFSTPPRRQERPVIFIERDRLGAST